MSKVMDNYLQITQWAAGAHDQSTLSGVSVALCERDDAEIISPDASDKVTSDTRFCYQKIWVD